MAVQKRMRVAPAAAHLGIHPQTLRLWADEGRIPCVRVGTERRFALADLDEFLGTSSVDDGRFVAVYCRVSGGGDQASSLAAQEAELVASVNAANVKVFRDTGSGLSSKRRNLNRLLDAVAAGKVAEVRVTHRDRLARFGVEFLERLLAAHDCRLVVLHDGAPATATDELLADFMSLVASFAGRMYGMRSAATKRRLLASADAKLSSGDTDKAPEAVGSVS